MYNYFRVHSQVHYNKWNHNRIYSALCYKCLMILFTMNENWSRVVHKLLKKNKVAKDNSVRYFHPQTQKEIKNKWYYSMSSNNKVALDLCRLNTVYCTHSVHKTLSTFVLLSWSPYSEIWGLSNSFLRYSELFARIGIHTVVGLSSRPIWYLHSWFLNIQQKRYFWYPTSVLSMNLLARFTCFYYFKYG